MSAGIVAWEETWTADVSSLGSSGACVSTPGGEGVFAYSPCPPGEGWTEGNHDDAARATLAAAAPDLVRALLEVEWVEHETQDGPVRYCPSCENVHPSTERDYRARDRGHGPGCELDDALRKAGERT